MGGLGYAGDMYAIHELSQAVRTRRQEIGLSQQRLATLAGLSRATIVQLEGGTLKDLSFTRTAAVLEVLGLGLTIAPARPRLGPRPVSSTPALEIAGRTASTSYRGHLTAAALGKALRTGEMPVGFEAHMFALVDEAPVQGSVERCGLSGVGRGAHPAGSSSKRHPAAAYPRAISRADIVRTSPTRCKDAANPLQTYFTFASNAKGRMPDRVLTALSDPLRVTIVVAFIETEPGAAMKDDSVEIRTSIQEQGSGTHAAARERR